MEEILEVKVVKIHRKTNKSVDTLAKSNLNLHCESLEFNECPDFMLNVLLRDTR